MPLCDRLVGATNLAIERTAGSAEVGFWIDAAAEGHGVVSRALDAVLGHAFGDLDLHRVEMRLLTTTNDRSHRLAERFAFTLEGVLRGAVRLPDGHRDVVVYDLLAADFTKATRRGSKFSRLNLLPRSARCITDVSVLPSRAVIMLLRGYPFARPSQR